MTGKFSTTYDRKEKNRWMRSGYFFVIMGFAPIMVELIIVVRIFQLLVFSDSGPEPSAVLVALIILALVSLVNLGTIVDFRGLRRSCDVIYQDFKIWSSDEEDRTRLDLLVDDVTPELKNVFINEGFNVETLCEGDPKTFIRKPGMWLPNRVVVERFQLSDHNISIELEYPSIEASVAGGGFRVNIYRYSKENHQLFDHLTNLLDKVLLSFEEPPHS